MKFEFHSKKLNKKYVLNIAKGDIQVFDGDRTIYETKEEVQLYDIIEALKNYERQNEKRA
jgi:hypothetical protein